MDHYGALGITPTATPQGVKAAYLALARRYHPDIVGPGHEEAITDVNHAWAVLGDRAARSEYDRSLAAPVEDMVVEPEEWGTEWVEVGVGDPVPAAASGPPSPAAFKALTWIALAGIALIITAQVVLWSRFGEYGSGALTGWIVTASTVLALLALFRPRWLPLTLSGVLALIWPLGGGARWWGFAWAFDELGLLASISVTVLGIAAPTVRLCVQGARTLWSERG